MVVGWMVSVTLIRLEEKVYCGRSASNDARFLRLRYDTQEFQIDRKRQDRFFENDRFAIIRDDKVMFNIV